MKIKQAGGPVVTLRFIEDCKRKWWKLWSVRLGALWALSLSYLWAVPGAMNAVLSQLPPQFQSAFPPILIISMFVLQTVIRLIHQPSIAAPASPATPTAEAP